MITLSHGPAKDPLYGTNGPLRGRVRWFENHPPTHLPTESHQRHGKDERIQLTVCKSKNGNRLIGETSQYFEKQRGGDLRSWRRDRQRRRTHTADQANLGWCVNFRWKVHFARCPHS